MTSKQYLMANKFKPKETNLNLNPQSITFDTPEEYRELFEKYNNAFIERTMIMQALEEERHKVIEMLKALYQSRRVKFRLHENNEKSMTLDNDQIDSTDDNVPDSIVITI